MLDILRPHRALASDVHGPSAAATSLPFLPSALLWTSVSGVALGLAYAASPVTCWFLVAMAGVFSWAGRGLSHGERRWVWRLLAVAVALRLLAVAVLFLSSDPHRVISFFWEGDGAAAVIRTMMIRNIWEGIPVPPRYFSHATNPLYGWTTSLYPMAYVQYVLGPAPYGIHLVNVGLFVATVVMLYRLIRSSFGRESALVGLALLLFLPTLFAWSVSALKEPPFVFLIALALVTAVTVLRARPPLTRALAFAALGASIATIDGVRAGGRMIAVVGLAAGFAGSVVLRRALLLLLVPVLLVIAGGHAINDPAIQRLMMSEIQRSAGIHIGHVNTEGHHYKLLDQRFYAAATSSVATMTKGEGVRFVVRALVSIMVFPLPWQIDSWEEMAFLPQQILWYALILLAIVGLFAGLRRDVLVTCMLAGVAIVGAAGVAINSGNFGTMVRHRDMVAPFIVWLSALGGVATLSKWTSRYRREASTGVAPHDMLEMPVGVHALDGR